MTLIKNRVIGNREIWDRRNDLTRDDELLRRLRETMLKRRSACVVLACCVSAFAVAQESTGYETETRSHRVRGADGPRGQRQFAELFTRWKVGELHLQYERDATGVGGAGGGRISPNGHQRR